jgi:hypothetical protein
MSASSTASSTATVYGRSRGRVWRIRRAACGRWAIFYFVQATVVSLPAAYLASWLLFILLSGVFDARYGYWAPA